MKKDYSGLLLLGGLGLIGYLLWKGGVFGESTGGGGGGGIGTTYSGYSEPIVNGQPFKVGIKGQATVGRTGTFYYVGKDKSGYVQREVNLYTTRAMRSPTVVQSRGIIKHTARIDVGKLLSTLKR